MTDLQRFSVAQIQEMAQSIAREVDDFTASLDQLESSLGAFKFRDPTGAYWTMGPRSRQWFCHFQVGWHPSNPPGGFLEGPEILNAWIGHRRAPLAQPARADLQVSNASAFLQATIQETRRAYDRGEIPSSTAEASLTGYYLLDRGGWFWTLGFRTGKWYYFNAGRWNPALNPPTPDTLVDLRSAAGPNCANCGAALGEEDKFCRNCGTAVPVGENKIPDQVSQAVLEFIELGMDTLPEPVTDTWSPPGGFPELIRQCQVCGRSDIGNHRHCRVCRSPLVNSSSSPAAVGSRLPNAPPPQPVYPAPPGGRPPQQPYPAYNASRVATAGRSRGSWWPWALGGGCALVLLCAAFLALIAWVAPAMGSGVFQP